MSVPKTVSDINVTSKVPILKITINKKYNRPRVSKVDENKLSSNISNTDIICEVEKSDMNKTIDPNLSNYTENIVAPSKAVIFNLIPVDLIPVLEKSVNYNDTFMETRHAYTPKIAYTRRGNLSRDTRNQSKAERIKYLHTKAQRDCDVLKIRLKALIERHQQEKKEIKRLQIYLGNLSKNKSINKIAKRYLKRKTSFVSLEDAEEDECEKLLRKVRKIKQEMLDLKYTITTSKKINEETLNGNSENGEYEILLENSICKNEDAEEDECDKLLRKVRTIKQEMLDLKYTITTSKEINEENLNGNTENGEYKILLEKSICKNEDTSNSHNKTLKHEENYVRSST